MQKLHSFICIACTVYGIQKRIYSTSNVYVPSQKNDLFADKEFGLISLKRENRGITAG